MIKLSTTVRVRLWPTIGVFVGLVGVGIFLVTRKEGPPEIQAASPEYRDLTATLSTNGKVTPIDGFAARSALPGMVKRIYVKLGEKVVPGQKIVQLQDPFAESRYTNAVAGLQGALAADDNFRHQGSQEDRINFAGDLKHAEAEQAAAASRLDLLKQLQQKGDATEAEASDAEQRLQAANTVLQTDRDRMTERFSPQDIAGSVARVADARAEVDTAKQVLANANMTTTIAGTVYSIPVSTYDYVPMGADLVLIANLDRVQIRAYFDEPDIGQLHAGEPVDVFWDGRPGASWRGHVEQPPMTVSPLGARMVGQCIITVENSNGNLLPNTDVTVRVETERHLHVLSVPREALHTEGGAHFVFRVVDGRLVRTTVTPGIVNLSFAEIASGLTTKDVVALGALNGSTLSKGLRVQVSQ